MDSESPEHQQAADDCDDLTIDECLVLYQQQRKRQQLLGLLRDGSGSRSQSGSPRSFEQLFANKRRRRSRRYTGSDDDDYDGEGEGEYQQYNSTERGESAGADRRGPSYSSSSAAASPSPPRSSLQLLAERDSSASPQRAATTNTTTNRSGSSLNANVSIQGGQPARRLGKSSSAELRASYATIAELQGRLEDAQREAIEAQREVRTMKAEHAAFQEDALRTIRHLKAMHAEAVGGFTTQETLRRSHTSDVYASTPLRNVAQQETGSKAPNEVSTSTSASHEAQLKEGNKLRGKGEMSSSLRSPGASSSSTSKQPKRVIFVDDDDL